MKLIAFAASNSSQSINKKLVQYVAARISQAEVEVLDLNDFEMPLFSQDRENELGQPQLAKQFLAKIANSDGIIVSFAEHNGCYSAAYKNLFDWCSRIETKVFQNKPMLVLSTSPGARGGASVMALALKQLPIFNGQIKASYSLPKFFENFDVENGIVKNSTFDKELNQAIDAFINN